MRTGDVPKETRFFEKNRVSGPAPSPTLALIPDSERSVSDYFAVAARGIEPVTAAELETLGATNLRVVPGGVHFEGDLATLYRANLWLRTATRVLAPLREFAAITQEMLYSQTRRVRWEDYLNPQKTLAVHATIEGSSRKGDDERSEKRPTRSRSGRERERSGPPKKGIHHSQFAALKIKDAIVDRLRREQGARPNVDRENPDILVNAHFAGGRCTLSLDSSGRSLHERGYRTQNTEAPLKETLAAAIIGLTGWDGSVPLYDPLCGSGTLVIEAALKSLRIAPGLFRETFPFQRWPDYDAALWAKLIEEARQQERDVDHPFVFGSDADPAAIRAAETNASRAGVADAVKFVVGKAEEATPPLAGPGVIVTNPPYGTRLGEEAEVRALYQRLGEHWPRAYPGWKAFVLAGNLGLARDFNLPAADKIKLMNGPLHCRLLRFDLPSQSH